MNSADFFIGVDIIDNNRFTNYDQKILQKILHPEEFNQFHLSLNNKGHDLQFLASRWAIKEAIFKATQLPIPMNKIFIEKRSNGSLSCAIDGWILKISLSHEKTYSVGMCLAIKNPI